MEEPVFPSVEVVPLQCLARRFVLWWCLVRVLFEWLMLFRVWRGHCLLGGGLTGGALVCVVCAALVGLVAAI